MAAACVWANVNVLKSSNRFCCVREWSICASKLGHSARRWNPKTGLRILNPAPHVLLS